MANKKRLEQLENLLDWEREGNRLPKTTELFNRQVAPTLSLVEVRPRQWAITIHDETEDGRINHQSIFITNATLVQLGLTILDAQKITADRFIKGDG